MQAKEAASGHEVVIGPTFTGFLDRVAPSGSRLSLTDDAVAILSTAKVSAAEPAALTGLVVGRVQSGKTLSYESVIALARDNGFALVIVVSGISTPLLDQGVKRLRGDLTAADAHGWNFFVNAGSDSLDLANLKSLRENWHDPDTPSSLRKTAVCLLLKHHGRIDKFVAACRDVDWAGLKVLIIDDEADQASLNTLQKRNKQSATYKQLLEMRSIFPHHVYLQYTATPQAPLLVTINDVLSPDFVRVIQPGSAYVGGLDYFGNSSKKLVSVINESDLEMAEDPNGKPPPSLVECLRLFVIGSSNVLAHDEPTTRSMLVHPSRVTAPHATFARWIKAIRGFWLDALGDEHDAAELQIDFYKSWQSLRDTDPEIASFENCWKYLRFALRNLQIIEMNAREGTSTPVIDWDESKSYVLVGGQALDRGFTVEGLSATYMPRGPGMWNADSIQQRARFFGYKRSYLGQCRVFLEPSLRNAFQKYVEHEKYMLGSLSSIQNGDKSLKDWEREFYLDPSMKPTRQSVISIPTIKVDPGERWIYDSSPVSSKSAGDDSVVLLEQLNTEVAWKVKDFGYKHGVITTGRALAFVEALPDLAKSKIPNIRGLKLQLAKLTDDATEDVAVIYVRPEITSDRTVTGSGAIQPFQGRSQNYPGDRAITDPSRITLQLHKIGVRHRKGEEAYAQMVVAAFWIPERLAGGWLLEESDR